MVPCRRFQPSKRILNGSESRERKRRESDWVRGEGNISGLSRIADRYRHVVPPRHPKVSPLFLAFSWPRESLFRFYEFFLD